MGLERVRDAVLSAARASAGGLLKAAGDEAERITADGRAEDERAHAAAMKEAQLRAERLRSGELGQVRQEGRRTLLAAKNRRLDEVFAGARERFLSLPPEERAAAGMVWLDAVAGEVGGELRVSPDEAPFYAGHLEELNRNRPAGARLAGMRADPDLVSGPRVAGSDSVADGTLDRRLERLREEAAAEVARMLFVP